MKKQWISCGIAAVFMVGCHCCAEAVEGVITASWLNARVFPELKSPRAAKLPRGQKVQVYKRHGAWLEIGAPATTPVYAAAAYLSGNKVLRDLNLRTEPASSAPVIARVKKGDTLKAVSEPNRYGWVQVAPSEDMRLYVMHEYVQYDSSKVPVARKAAPAVQEPEKQEAPAPAPVKKEAPKAEAPAPAPAPAPVKKEAPKAEKKEAPAPKAEASAPVKKEAPKAEKPAPAPVKKEALKAEKKEAPAPKAEKPAPAPVKKEAPKVAPAPAPAKKESPKFELTEERKRELLNIGADLNAPAPYAKTGTLVLVPAPGGDCTRFALTDIADGRNLGFLFAEAPIKLQSMANKTVSVKGFAYRIAKWQNPVVAVTEITRVGE